MQPLWEHLDTLGIPTGHEWMLSARGPIVREVMGQLEIYDDTAQIETELPSSGPVETFPPTIMAPGSGESQNERRTVPADSAPLSVTISRSELLADREANPEESQNAVSSYPLALPSLIREDSPELADLEEELVEVTGESDRPDPRDTASSGLMLAPYVRWRSRPLPAVSATNLSSVQFGLIDIIRAEGPMIARQAELRYVQAPGANALVKRTKGFSTKPSVVRFEQDRRIESAMVSLES